MEFVGYAVAILVLLALNGFFVLAEFAIVRVRSSRVEELIERGDPRARLVADIQARLDDYLAVCQVGITLASVALGMVGQLATLAVQGEQPSLARMIAAMLVSYVLVAGAHIVLGELVPKSLAIRVSDRAALWCARPLLVFRRLFFLPLWVLNRLANLLVRLLGFPEYQPHERHSVDELRIILDRSQAGGLLSFRRLLYIENVFDLGELKARDAMRPARQVRVLDARRSWAENLAVIRESRLSRFPLIEAEGAMPSGIVHVKDLLFALAEGREPEVRALARPAFVAADSTPLEQLLAELQRRRQQVALLTDGAGQWVGLVSFEDVIEELIGTVSDEFETELQLSVADAITPGRVVLGLSAGSIAQAARLALTRVPAEELPLPAETIAQAVIERERLACTYLGRGIAMPHARLAGLERPLLVFARAEQGVPVDGSPERARLFFILLTPAGQPRVHQRLQARIAEMLENSAFVVERLHDADSAQAIVDVLRTGEQAAID
ncbi:MAG: CNNM domain-containing protein [Planctomycetota bacterium]|nr:CNNM domain-containing protein [Planctomycetota bacterium]MCX8039403.1 CNNM domain-containing protein [Planctomycetota bacterium]MDW8373321.1 CNNM domain-containing protein [Planctomycetota bacterium]